MTQKMTRLCGNVRGPGQLRKITLPTWNLNPTPNFCRWDVKTQSEYDSVAIDHCIIVYFVCRSMMNDVMVIVWYSYQYGLSLNQSLLAQLCVSMVEWLNHIDPARPLKVFISWLPMSFGPRHSSKTLQVCSGPPASSLGNGVKANSIQCSPVQFAGSGFLKVLFPKSFGFVSRHVDF